MAGFTNRAFRQLCKDNGADVLVTEFVFADAFLRGGPRVWEMVDFTPSQRPMGVQLFGSDPATLTEAARRIVDALAPDFIDLNCGCPADRITCMHAGSSLLRDLPRLAHITQGLVRALPGVPVTAKVRLGWDDQSIVVHEVARLLHESGVQALAIHGRTKEQGYSGDARWDLIAEVAATSPLPVIGNGNLRTADDVAGVFAHTACAGAMLGRAALGYPWLFREIKQTLATGLPPAPPTLAERWQTILQYARLMLDSPTREEQTRLRFPGDIAWLRPRLHGLTKEMTGCKRLRPFLEKTDTLAGLEELAARHLDEFAARDAGPRPELGGRTNGVDWTKLAPATNPLSM